MLHHITTEHKENEKALLAEVEDESEHRQPGRNKKGGGKMSYQDFLTYLIQYYNNDRQVI